MTPGIYVEMSKPLCVIDFITNIAARQRAVQVSTSDANFHNSLQGLMHKSHVNSMVPCNGIG